MPARARNAAGLFGNRRPGTMLHQLLFLAFYLGLFPIVLVSAFTGVLIYYWLDYMPPDFVYSASLLSLRYLAVQCRATSRPTPKRLPCER